uniref:Serpentine Receptor, class Z n=1 Tax=Caenorhabditis tropicalis TaxID=1561998 RepID=A0A1I7THA7_9PELO
MIKLFYFICIFYFIFIILLLITGYGVFCVVVAMYYVVSDYLIFIVTEVNHFLLSLLAIQRFLLYFVPSSDKYLNISGRTMKVILRCSYGAISLVVAVEFYILIKTYLNPMFDDHGLFMLPEGIYIGLNVLLMASTLLYLPIMISIQKLGRLASAQLNKPQRFVLWQMVAVFIGKLVLIPFAIMLSDVTGIISGLEYTDGIYTLIIVQLTYLGCNRHNLQSLLSTLKPRNFFRVLFCPWRLKEQVEPGVYQIESTGRN